MVTPLPPSEGECRDLSFQQTEELSDDSGTVPCKRPHTAVTYAVEELPDSVDIEGVSIGNQSIQRAAAASCRSAFNHAVGGDAADRAASRFTYTYYVPDQAGFDAGARWVRCDAVAMRTDTSLAELPASVDDILDDSDAAADFAVCSRGEPGTADSALVTCSQPHDYSVVEAIRLGGNRDSFPGKGETLADGRSQCRQVVEDTLDTQGGFTFTWTYPTRKDWNDGHRFGYCWLAA